MKAPGNGLLLPLSNDDMPLPSRDVWCPLEKWESWVRVRVLFQCRTWGDTKIEKLKANGVEQYGICVYFIYTGDVSLCLIL